MAKDLPYFKFFCSEWTDGDITLEDYETQGVFINICSYYWSNECSITLTKLRKKFRNNEEAINILIESEILKEGKDDSVEISFLDEQLVERGKTSVKNSKAGKASAEARKRRKVEQESNQDLTSVKIPLNENPTIKKREEEKRKEKNNILPDNAPDKSGEINTPPKKSKKPIKDLKGRKSDFKEKLDPYLEKYGKEMLNAFYLFWTEHGEDDKKMHFEKQKTFGLPHRLARWNANNYGNKNNKQDENNTKLSYSMKK